MIGKNDIRCPVCLTEGIFAERKESKRCPTCNTVLTPLLRAEDGYVKVNWQDLRVLANYASRWAVSFDMSNPATKDSFMYLQNILQQLRAWRPKDAKPLTPEDQTLIFDALKRSIALPKTTTPGAPKGCIVSPYFNGRIR